MIHEFDAKDLKATTFTFSIPMAVLSVDTDTVSKVEAVYTDRTETWISDGEKFTQQFSHIDLIAKWAIENCEFGPEYKIDQDVFREAYNTTMGVDASKDEFGMSMGLLPNLGKYDHHGCYVGLRIRDKEDEVQKLAEQLAQPWPENVTCMKYNIDGQEIHITHYDDGDNLYHLTWGICSPDREYQWNLAKTLEEAAYAVAEIVVGR